MPAKELKLRFFKSLPRSARLSLLVALVPALCWGAYTVFGESGLIALALALPVLWVIYGGYESTTAVQSKQNGLNQRSSALAQLESRINDMLFSAQADARLAIFCLELDSAPEIIRSLGETNLQNIQDRLQMRYASCLRSRDIVFRSGPLHWTIVIEPSPKLNLDVVIAQAKRLQAVAEEPLFINDDRLYVSSSLGFSLTQSPFKSAHVLLSQCQNALSDAALNGPGAMRTFSPASHRSEMPEPALQLKDLDGDINTSLSAWFQPQISTDTGQIAGFEALARWHDASGHMHAPATILPILRQHGMMERLTEIILMQSLQALSKWDQNGLGIDTVGVNFSETDLANPKLYEKIAWDLDRFDIEPSRLCIEVLESVIAGDANDLVVRNVSRLSELGCRIDLDDFGTGHSSISTLRQLPVNRLKIDRSFVTKADVDSEQQRMIATILMMAERLDLTCLAEGVETLGEQSILGQLGCRYVQGFGIAKPMPFDLTVDWIEKFQDRRVITPEIGRKTS